MASLRANNNISVALVFERKNSRLGMLCTFIEHWRLRQTSSSYSLQLVGCVLLSCGAIVSVTLGASDPHQYLELRMK